MEDNKLSEVKHYSSLAKKITMSSLVVESETEF